MVTRKEKKGREKKEKMKKNSRKDINVRLKTVFKNGHQKGTNLSFGCGVRAVTCLESASFMQKMKSTYRCFVSIKKIVKKNRFLHFFK